MEVLHDSEFRIWVTVVIAFVLFMGWIKFFSTPNIPKWNDSKYPDIFTLIANTK